MSKSQERIFQNEIISQMLENGWKLGDPKAYDRERALYPADLLEFVQMTQPKEWEKFCKLYPQNPAEKLSEIVVNQLQKADINATNEASRKFGTLGVLRHGVRSRNVSFSLCQFKPEGNLNPEILANYERNILRVVPELVYSPHIKNENTLDQKQAKRWRIDLVLFLNGLPIITMELKSEFKQAIEQAITQYKRTRLPKDPVTKKVEPLLTFKRGALVHFAVSQYEVYMTTHLQGENTFFLPFNRGTKEGGAGNDVPENPHQYATDYLWNEVFTRDHLLNIIGNFIHLQIEDKEDYNGRKYKRETLIFPRLHQWDVVTKLLNTTVSEGVGQRYLIQHSAGSGKSNSIAWTAHQLSKLTKNDGSKQFDSVIVVTDRKVLDSQLQDTIYQFEHADGVVEPINDKVGQGSKSEKLAKALEMSKPIIIVTIQTFPFVLSAIENSLSLKMRNFAIIADEAHSSQSGITASELKKVLMVDSDGNEELSAEDMVNLSMSAKGRNSNLSYYAFTATPKQKTLELFGRCPNPELPPSADNKPAPFHIYSMRQAIEEGFILDVLQNYTNYKVIYQLKQRLEAKDEVVDEKKAKIKLNRWVRLHDHNISQKVKVIIEHFNDNIAHLLNGQAKAMVVTSSRKEAVRYKLAFDKYITEQKYSNLAAMVAFSGEVIFNENDPDSAHLLEEKFTENNMNPGLKGREMRKAFDSDDYQVMIVANKFQTGFDQPKLCAMYVDKKLGGVECVQTLSRLNRTYPGKAEAGTFILDFFNDPEEILEAFQPYYQTATLEDVTDPDIIFDLSDKLRASGIFTWTEVEQFIEYFYNPNSSAAAISNICKPAVERWRQQYEKAIAHYEASIQLLKRTQKTEDPVLIANAENDLKETKIEKDRLEIFKKDLGTYVRTYEFLSQIVDYEDPELEKLSFYARHLRPMLREQIIEEDEIDLNNVEMTHYRLSEIRKQSLKLQKDEEALIPSGGAGGTAKPRDKKEEFLSIIINRLNEVFVTENITAKDMINYAYTIRDKISENQAVMTQIINNPREQALLGDFPRAGLNAIIESGNAHQDQMTQLLSDETKMENFLHIVFDMLTNRQEMGMGR